MRNYYPAEKTSLKSQPNFGPSFGSTKTGPGPGKQKTVRTLVAMPAFNEESQVAKTIVGSQKYADAVLVVDDGSTDATAEIVGALGVMVIRHEGNRGYGSAMKTIFKTARDLGVEELIVIDSDGEKSDMCLTLPHIQSNGGNTS
jgi:cellulose synthase/poly-beta-1,6-N-acetylglucosamine synthase-like glycosyltransferase